SDPVVDYTLGNLYLETGDYTNALTAYQSALGRQPHFYRAIRALGRLHLLQGEAAKTIELYQPLIREGGRADADLYLLLGYALMAQGRLISAEQAYRSALLLEPESRDALRGLGQCMLYGKRYREAYALFDEFTADQLEGAEVWDIKARAALALEDTPSAMMNLECAHRLGFATDSMKSLLGDVYLNENMAELALPQYLALLQTTNAPVDHLLQAVRVMMALGRFEEADSLLEHLDVAPLTEKQQAQWQLASAERAWQMGSRAEAERRFRDYLKAVPLDAQVLLRLGDLLRENGKAEEALMQYERAGRADADVAAEAAVRCGMVEVQRQRYRAALEWLEKAQTLDNQVYVGRYVEQLRRMLAP
ncbi:MAG: tetratricopeptide repeat protein, partial [Kiritimatiellae bacterium]|nr:tetratricopeptide repeat protein [Kiritimatiellia bacterium]